MSNMYRVMLDVLRSVFEKIAEVVTAHISLMVSCPTAALTRLGHVCDPGKTSRPYFLACLNGHPHSP